MQSRASFKPELKVIELPQTPSNVEAEEAILGAILFDPEAIARVADILTPAMFYMTSHQEIYRAAISLHHQGRPTDLMGVLSFLHDKGSLEATGGQSRLADLFDSVVSAVNVDQWALLVQEKYLRRQLIKVSAEIGDRAADGKASIETVLSEAEKRIFEIGQGTATDALVPVSETIHTVFNDVERRSEGGKTPGIPCGYYDLDAMTGGWQPEDLIIIAGRPAQGKTSFALNVARNIAGINKLPVAIFSLEMATESLNYRLISSEAQIETGRLKEGRIAGNEWETLGHAVSAIAATPIAINDAPNPSVAAIRSKSRRYMAESGGKLGGIVIDYIQLMGGSSEGSDGNRVQELSRITRGLKQLARELKCPVFALSQLNRGVESRGDKRPLMSDLRESGSIEQDADIIVMLYRDDYYNKESPDRGIAEIIIAKHRNGPVGTVKLLFQPQFTKFINLAVRHG